MPCDGSHNTNHLQPWARVLDGSHLELSVEPEGTGVVPGARLVIDPPGDGSEEKLFELAQLVPGPVRVKLEAPISYVVRVRVGFTSTAQASAVIAARIVKPDGTLHGAPYRYCVSGKKGAEGRSTITIATRKE